MRKLFGFSIAWAWAISASGILEGKISELRPEVHRFLQDYCIKCHGPDEKKGDRAFHQMAELRDGKWMMDFTKPGKANLLHDVLDQLNLGEMPPKKKGVRQPTIQEIKATVRWLAKVLLEQEKEKRQTETVLRRLNRLEYRNSMRDLLGLGNLPFDLTEDFPADDQLEGFTNIGDALRLSKGHLDAYLKAADLYLRMAFRFDEPRKAETLVIKPQEWGYRDREPTTPWMYRLHVKDKHLDIGAGKKQLSDHFSLGTVPQDFARRGGIQVSGYYRVSITAEAIRRLTHPYDPIMIPTDLNPPMQLGLYISRGTKGLASDSVKSRSRVGLWDLADHRTKKFEVTVWMDKGDLPFLNWDNGPGPSDYWMRDILKKYHTDVEFRGKQGSHAWHIIGKDAVPGRLVSDVWKGPLLRIHDMHIHGPTYGTFHSKAQQVFLDGQRDLAKVDLATTFSRFARRAFRRPLAKPEIEPYLRLEKNARENLGRTPEEAFFLALKAMLVSPDFLYLREEASTDKQIGPFELANRLSYFLWGSLPDNELFNLAKNESIRNPEVLGQQVRRLLVDPRSDSFVEGFASSWLRLNKLGTMPPDSLKFREYYNYGLEESMIGETHQFLRHAIKTNAPLSDFIHSDYGFLNQDLARHYGIKGVEGLHLRKVSLPEDGIRGGLLGQASILTLTANGVDTSPVVRGIWVLESLLGTPPAPPPPDVEPIDPDVRGAKTVKQLLEKHRSVETCADCHDKIDPFGFPLEFFDPVGGYRPTYYRSRYWKRSQHTTVFFPSFPIDGSATLASGESFEDPRGLKEALLGKKDLLARNLTEKLLAYGTGRTVTLWDEKEIGRISKLGAEGRLGFRKLIVQVVTSGAFRRK
jgi:hypothetical protein